MNTWFDIQAKANDEAEIFLYDEIGGFGVNAKSFIDTVSQFIISFAARTSPSRLMALPRQFLQSSRGPAKRSASPVTGSS